MQGLPGICLAGRRRVRAAAAVKKGLRWSWPEQPPAAAQGPDPAQPRTTGCGAQGAAAAAGLHLGTSARGTRAGVVPVDAAKLEPGRRARTS